MKTKLKLFREELKMFIKKRRLLPMNQHGGAALEYILVTTFAAVVGIAALAYTGKAIKSQLSQLGEKLKVDDAVNLDLGIFNSERE